MSPSIKIQSLSKSYGKVLAVNNISLKIMPGELFGLIGPDGAGKTSIFRILTTLLIPDKGKASMDGLDTVKDYKAIRNIVGYMPGRFSLYQDLSIKENLEFFATAFGTTVEENYHLIKDIYTQIEPFKNRLAGRLSGGMKQKLALSCALIHKPKILILDEPTTGVDAVSRKEFWEMLLRLKTQGITIMVATPYMDEASLCDRVALIQNGNILKTDSPQSIVDKFEHRVYAIKTQNKYKTLKLLQQFNLTHSVFPFGEQLHFIANNDNNIESKTKTYLKLQDINDTEFLPITPTIEDVFMNEQQT
ncbi:ABC transporter ATP-binding protein [Bacteroidales bacterium]|nr:ABC transporter ATP-binding protein [Bacteroidales bacterium]